MSDKFDRGAITGNWPKNLSYEGEDTASGNRIKNYFSSGNGAHKKKESFFYDKTALDIFLMAMSVGKDLGVRTKLKKKQANLPTKTLSENQIWAMISVVLSEENSNLETLEDGNAIFTICEEYANGGIETVMDWDESGETGNKFKKFIEKFEEKLE